MVPACSGKIPYTPTSVHPATSVQPKPSKRKAELESEDSVAKRMRELMSKDDSIKNKANVTKERKKKKKTENDKAEEIISCEKIETIPKPSKKKREITEIDEETVDQAISTAAIARMIAEETQKVYLTREVLKAGSKKKAVICREAIRDFYRRYMKHLGISDDDDIF